MTLLSAVLLGLEKRTHSDWERMAKSRLLLDFCSEQQGSFESAVITVKFDEPVLACGKFLSIWSGYAG